jgi:hypothetical protein
MSSSFWNYRGGLLKFNVRGDRWLLDGLKMTQHSAHRELHYETVL